MPNKQIRISSRPNELVEGLFGQVILYVFEILPYLYEQQIFPDWAVSCEHYKFRPHGCVIPGVVDLAYEVEPGCKKDINLLLLRLRHRHVLGNDWRALSKMWNTYFRIPDRISRAAAAVGPLSDAVGIHYRGNDKHEASWDTNPVSHDDYLPIICDLLKNRPGIRRVFLATDDFRFYHFLRGNTSLQIINLGAVGFHKDPASATCLDVKADRAMLDCVLLSRCGVVLQTSSGLSAFAKILNPDLEIYRVAASKRFYDVPYFPVAYIPRFNSPSPQISALVDRLMLGDWTQDADADLFSERFAARPRWPRTSPIRFLKSYLRALERWPAFKWVGRLRIALWKFTFALSRKR